MLSYGARDGARTRDPLLGKIICRDLCLTEPENRVFRLSLPSASGGQSPLLPVLSCFGGSGSRARIVSPIVGLVAPAAAGASGVLWRLSKLVAGALDQLASQFAGGLVAQRRARIAGRKECGVAHCLAQ